eukprot:1183157-Prorocentrum_minimum.AAC.1
MLPRHAEEGRNAPCPSSAGVLRVTPPRWAARACGRGRGEGEEEEEEGEGGAGLAGLVEATRLSAD